MLPPIGEASSAVPPVLVFSAVAMPDRRRIAKTATSSSTTETSSSGVEPSTDTSEAVIADPLIAPTVAPAAMNPNSRVPCSRDEHVDHEGPEDRDDEQVEDRRPDEEDAADPDLLRGAGHEQQREEDQQVGLEEAVGVGDELAVAAAWTPAPRTAD